MDMIKRWTKEECEIYNDSFNGRRKRGRPRKRLPDEVEEDLNVMGIRNDHIVARD